MQNEISVLSKSADKTYLPVTMLSPLTRNTANAKQVTMPSPLTRKTVNANGISKQSMLLK